MGIDISGYSASFRLLTHDLVQVFEYIEPVPDHERVYSHRLFALLLRACTDFESIAKELVVATSLSNSARQMNVNDYKRLEDSFKLEQCKVALNEQWPTPFVLHPYRGWSTQSPPLPWYGEYNAVKHNRQQEFPRANLLSALNATAAVFVLLAVGSEYEWDEIASGPDSSGTIGASCDLFTATGLPRRGLFTPVQTRP